MVQKINSPGDKVSTVGYEFLQRNFVERDAGFYGADGGFYGFRMLHYAHVYCCK